jgi:hypothetical protein
VSPIVAEKESPVYPGRPEAPPADRSWPWTRIAVLVGVAALAVPFVTMVVVALTRPWIPSADVALMELRVFDVGGAHTPLTGAYSRLGWNHPGPLAFWLLAVPYRLGGAGPAGLAVGTIAVHAAAVAGSVALAWRRGGAALAALTALVLALVIRGLGAGFLALTWNPDLPVLALAFLVLATWSVIEGDLWLMPIVVAVACFAWQSHVIYLPVTALLVGVALVAAVVHLRRRPGAGRSAWWIAGATAVTALVCLAPLVLDELTGSPGNLHLIVSGLLHPADAPIGIGQAAAIAAAHLSPVGTWLSGIDPANRLTAGALGAAPGLLVLPVVAAGGAGVVAWRSGERAAARLVALTAACALVATVEVTRTTGVPYIYLFDWLRALSALLWAAVAWALITTIRSRPAWPERRSLAFAVVAGVLIAGLAAASLGGDRGTTLPDEPTSDLVRALVPGTLAATAGQPRVAVDWGGGWCAGEIGHGLAVALVERGVEVAVPETSRLEYGAPRVRHGEPLPQVELVCGPDTPGYLARTGLTPVAATGMLSDAETAELHGLQDQFREQLVTGGSPELVPAVENQGLVWLAQDGVVGTVDLGRARLARFGELMDKGRRSAAVLYHPA